MKNKIFGMVPVIGAALLGMVLSQLTIGDQTSATGQGRVFDEVNSVSPVNTVEQFVPEYQPLVPAEEGAGYQPPVDSSGECVCPCDGKCLDEAAVRKIVRDEFNNQVMAEKVAPRSSIPNAVSYVAPAVNYASPTVTYSSPAVTYTQQPATSQPTTTVRRGLFGRRVVTYQSAPASNGTCRVVNGQMICNQ